MSRQRTRASASRKPRPAPRKGAAPSVPAEPSLSERAARSLEAMRRRTLPFEQALLEDALDLAATLRTVVAAFVPGFADWCFVDLLDAEGGLRRVEIAHADPNHALVAEEYRAVGIGPGWATPSAQAVRDRSPRIYSRLNDELMAWATWDERHLAALKATAPNSLMAIPLLARGTAIGALTLLRSGTSPPFWGDDLRKAVALAAPAGLALDIARRYAAATAPGRRRRRP
jgi:GAF domain-containing protein